MLEGTRKRTSGISPRPIWNLFRNQFIEATISHIQEDDSRTHAVLARMTPTTLKQQFSPLNPRTLIKMAFPEKTTREDEDENADENAEYDRSSSGIQKMVGETLFPSLIVRGFTTRIHGIRHAQRDDLSWYDEFGGFQVDGDKHDDHLDGFGSIQGRPYDWPIGSCNTDYNIDKERESTSFQCSPRNDAHKMPRLFQTSVEAMAFGERLCFRADATRHHNEDYGRTGVRNCDHTIQCSIGTKMKFSVTIGFQATHDLRFVDRRDTDHEIGLCKAYNSSINTDEEVMCFKIDELDTWCRSRIECAFRRLEATLTNELVNEKKRDRTDPASSHDMMDDLAERVVSFLRRA
jgi:hypothetical protein